MMDISDLVTAIIEKAEPKKIVEITENQYYATLTDNIQAAYSKYHQGVEALQDLQCKLARGYNVHFYTDGENLWYVAKEKKPVGFK